MQEPIQEGYTWFNGVVLDAVDLALYNKFTTEINESSGDVREFLLDQRHRYLTLCLNETKQG